MAARPSPAALKARAALEKEQASHEKTKATLRDTVLERLKLAQRLDDADAHTNGYAAAKAEVQTLRVLNDAANAEVGYLRSTLNRVTNGGVFVTGLQRA